VRTISRLVKFLHWYPRKIYTVTAAFKGPNFKYNRFISEIKRFLHGTTVAMYIVGQERRLVDPPSQVVAGVRTVTTNMDGRDALPRMSRPFAL
ncbi:MAG TPA: hypothetical protein VN843_32580, partial [Anaerolineales bacterium]|nr:hypothetical protein [Anaerolineales bacterium]